MPSTFNPPAIFALSRHGSNFRVRICSFSQAACAVLLALAPGLVSAITYNQWKAAMLPLAALAAVTAPEASDTGVDLDGDGAGNLEEYVFVGDPLVAENNLCPQLTLNQAGLGLTYRERHGMSDVDVHLQGSDDLTTWVTYNHVTEARRVVLADDDEVTLLDPAPSGVPRRFVRLRMELAPVPALRAPQQPRLTALSPILWRLAWTDPNPAEVGYAVEQLDPTTGSWSRLATLGADQGNWQQTVADTETPVTYRVVAIAANGEEMASAAVTGGAIPVSTVPLVLVVAGQSNAVGFGTSGLPPPAALLAPQEGVYYWRDVAVTGAPRFGFQVYQAGVNSVPTERSAIQLWGPEAEFARLFRAANPGRPLYIIKSAVSGAQLCDSAVQQVAGAPTRDWAPNSVNELFDETIGRISGAKAALAASGITGYETAVLWMQGESDASNAVSASKYYTNLGALIIQARARWGLGSPPFILGRITSAAWAYSSAVRMAQVRVAAEVADTRMISTDGFPLVSDNKHYSDVGNVALGNAFYAAYTGTSPQVPVVLPPALALSLVEKSVAGVIVGNIAPVGAPQPTPTYEFLSGEISGLKINPATGVITVTNGAVLDVLTDPVRVFKVRAANGAGLSTSTVTLTLTLPLGL